MIQDYHKNKRIHTCLLLIVAIVAATITTVSPLFSFGDCDIFSILIVPFVLLWNVEDVGHTVQINDKTKDLTVYYEHYGDEQQGYAGVPVGWYAKSYAWLPYALYYHRMSKYLEYLEGMNSTSWDEASFETFLSVHDDDMYENPPDDWFVPDDEIGLVDA
jgi:hypothetical protein